MFAVIRKRLGRRQVDIKESEDDDKDELQDFAPPPSYIKISQGKIQLVNQPKSLENGTSPKDKSQCGSPTFEKELREQLDNMNRAMKSKERKTMQTCRDHKVLQSRCARQEARLEAMKQSNKALVDRIRQYERCLDDVMRKIVDAIVVEDNLREEVTLLKNRVRDLEAQNAALSASPAKGRDEGYCTMSSGQPQPSNGHLEDLPEEPEHWILPAAEPCSTEMEDWSMSQEELAVITLDDDLEQHQQRYHHQSTRQRIHGVQQQQQQHKQEHGEHDWIWNSNDFLNSTVNESDSDGISQLLQQKIVYSEDEDVACVEFTNDFYKLVNIRPGSTRSLYSYIEGETDDEDDDEDSSSSDSRDRLRCRTSLSGLGADIPPSPTPSEAGQAQVTSCSSSESDELSRCTTAHQELVETSDTMDDGVQPDDDNPNKSNEIVQVEVNSLKKLEQRHYLVKSKSTVEEDEPSCILRNNQRREIESAVVRSGSANCGIAASSLAGKPSQDRCILQKTSVATSWRKSNGWKRLASPAVPLKKEKKLETPKSIHHHQNALPTRIPTSIPQFQQQQHHSPPSPPTSFLQHQQPQLSPIRKSKIPPPVPVRRSYAS